jgi:hypothetical protein
LSGAKSKLTTIVVNEERGRESSLASLFFICCKIADVRNFATIHGEQLARRKELYEAKHPQTKQGARGRGSEKHITEKDAESAPLSFKDDAAAKTSQSARTISENVQIASRIPAW